LLLDASIFSRAIIGGYNIRKYQSKEETEIVVGRLTGLYGNILKYSKVKLLFAPTKFEDGSILHEVGGKEIYKIFEVPAGLTFDRLISELSKLNYYPALFPMYLKGTIGGFIALNGSGFGSYKFGFVKNIKTVHELIDYKVARITAVKYPEVLESEEESKFSWSAILIDDTTKYYIPSIYNKFLEHKISTISTDKVIKEIENRIYKIFKRDYIPIILKMDHNKALNFNFDVHLGYIIKYNSPKKYKVLIGRIEENRLPELFEYLRKNKDVVPFPYLKEYEEYHEAIIEGFKKYEIKIKDKKLKNIVIDASKCINCSLCLDVCLSYNTTKNILFSPLGRFNRLLTGESNFESCFGCKACEEICPVQINISNITETLPQFNNTKEKLVIEVSDLPKSIYELEKILDSKYRNKPIFLLFVGCSSKYDPLGVEGFLNYLLINGNKLPPEFSPRVKIIAGYCCGFDKYLAGNLEEAKIDVERINKMKIEQNAIGVYFLCPEGLYVYNKLSNQKGIFAFDIIKNDLKDKNVHLGCWAKKLGYTSQYNDCAGLFFTSYKDSPVKISKKNYLTVCPFSTWKFGTISVYSTFIEKREITEIKKEEAFDENIIYNQLIRGVEAAIDKAVDEIAEKVSIWKLGGEQYFVLLSIPIMSKYINSELIRNFASDPQVKQFFYSISQNRLLLEQKIKTYVDYITHYNFENKIIEFSEEILKSNKLDYSAMDIVKTNEFRKALKEILMKSINENLLSNIINSVIYL